MECVDQDPIEVILVFDEDGKQHYSTGQLFVYFFVYFFVHFFVYFFVYFCAYFFVYNYSSGNGNRRMDTVVTLPPQLTGMTGHQNYLGNTLQK